MSKHLLRRAAQPLVRFAKKYPTITVALVIWLMFVPVKNWQQLYLFANPSAQMQVQFGPLWRIDLFLFDYFTKLQAPGEVGAPVEIVGIDEYSMVEEQWPWPRSKHALLVDKLREAGAKAIVFDVVFSEPDRSPAEDTKFAAAIKKHGQVVLAADIEQIGDRFTMVLPHYTIREGAIPALASVVRDPDQTVRMLPLGHPSSEVPPLWFGAWQAYSLATTGQAPAFDPKGLPYIRYVGPHHTFKYTPFKAVISEKSDAELKQQFAGKIVFVGRDLKASPEILRQTDMLGTPFTSFDGALSPGVEIHANALVNALKSSWLIKLSGALETTLFTVFLAIAAFLMRRWKPFLSGMITLGLLIAIFLGGWFQFKTGVWWPIRDAMLGVLLVYFVQGAIAYITETLKRREIKDAFSRYVSPELVDQIAANPEALKLGGQRKELTIMFTDLAGFTSIAEALTAEQVERIMNRQFSVLTAIVYKYGGTLDKYIGDAIMAFWNAPLDDPQHATHACKCAIEMQQAMAQLRQEFIDEGFPPIHMRVGLHTGVCMVGNFGSEIRFNYTVMGDTVNLASRLEGSNKQFHTYILVSDQVAAQAEGVSLCPIGRIRVKGKSEPTAVLTPIDDPELLKTMAAAYEAYLQRNWDLAESGFLKVQESTDLKGVADNYLANIAHFRAEPPPPEWDGTDTLEVK